MSEGISLRLEPVDNLKPCPFCRSTKIELLNTWTPKYWLDCQRCGCQMHGNSYWLESDPEGRDMESHQRAKDDVINQWNHRPCDRPEDGQRVKMECSEPCISFGDVEGPYLEIELYGNSSSSGTVELRANEWNEEDQPPPEWLSSLAQRLHQEISGDRDRLPWALPDGSAVRPTDHVDLTWATHQTVANLLDFLERKKVHAVEGMHSLRRDGELSALVEDVVGRELVRIDRLKADIFVALGEYQEKIMRKAYEKEAIAQEKVDGNS